ncbi:hypothetical protein CEUSTIGMA_g4694.t1 [Chlamydomonas eustigma]|uniref:Uncharacterized protein n=1 Tax=Chlamydomonas eustigma TaxID=1157962 RepID=A0A250X2F6_9CHLO|nr:hypothetical protein CEUSTIGMA_g4694.t1 [Chlamydomonas eustigma]|eukprot:GAX77248.1 hypothetical protein CEUSTIGMA_g4694.t1 [Chlamydomonas eustigma]
MTSLEQLNLLYFVYDLDIPLLNARVPFHKTAFELVKRVSQSKIPDGAIKTQLDKMTQAFFKGLGKDEFFNFSTAVVVSRIQRKWRAYIRNMKLRCAKAWRLDRSFGIPRYHDIDISGLGLRYRGHKEATIAQRCHEGSQGIETSESHSPRAGSRWRFNPQYHCQATA